MREVISGSLRLLDIRSVVRIFVRHKPPADNFYKRIHKDNKLLFGPLLETKKEKTARIKREKRMAKNKKSVEPNEPQTHDRAVDTELAWLRGQTRVPMRPITFLPTDIPRCQKKIYKKLPPAVMEKFQNLENAKDRQDHAFKSVEEISAVNSAKFKNVANSKDPEKPKDASESPDNDEIKEPKKKNSPLADILIQNMTTFSIFDRSKKIDPETRRERGIISISQYNSHKSIFPSVTRILSATMSEESKLNLELWKQRMILELGQEGFEIYSRELLQNGQKFHFAIQSFFTNIPFDVPDTVKPSWESLQTVLKEVSKVEAVETHAVHSELQYRGIVDCVAWYRGKLCVIDWKKSDKPKNTINQTYDAPVQVASYIGALNADENYPFEIKNGLVVVAYTNGDLASVHELDENNLQKYWKLWLRRLQKYHLEL